MPEIIFGLYSTGLLIISDKILTLGKKTRAFSKYWPSNPNWILFFKNSYDLSGGKWSDASAIEYGLPLSAYESRVAGRPWKLKWEPKIDPNEYIEINQAWVDSHEYPYYLSKNSKLVEDISFSWEDQFFIFFEEGLTFDGCGNKIIININNYRGAFNNGVFDGNNDIYHNITMLYLQY